MRRVPDAPPPSLLDRFRAMPPDSPLPSPAPGVMFQPLDDGAVLFSPATEVYFGLNHVGAAVWELLPPASASLRALCAELAERYPDAAPVTLAEDVTRLLAELAREGLVVPPAADR